MGSLVTNASPFLFPCTIEYSLICAVILFEMWKKMKTIKVKMDKDFDRTHLHQQHQKEDKISTHFNFSKTRFYTSFQVFLYIYFIYRSICSISSSITASLFRGLFQRSSWFVCWDTGDSSDYNIFNNVLRAGQ